MKEQVRVGFGKVSMASCLQVKPGWILHDDLSAGVLVIHGNEGAAVLVTLDYIQLPGKQVEQVKNGISAAAGIPPERQVITCSHTHSVPLLDAAALGGVLGPAVKKAAAAAQPAFISFRRADTGKRYFVNRRKKAEPLGVFTCGYLRGTAVDTVRGRVDVRGTVADFIRHGINIYDPRYADAGIGPGDGPDTPSAAAGALLQDLPEHLYLDGPVDPCADMLTFTGEDGRFLGGLARTACHPVIFRGSRTRQYSADFPGVMTRKLEQRLGGPVLFINGPCGDIKPVFDEYGAESMEAFGTGLAALLAEAGDGAEPEPLEHFAFLRREEPFTVAPDMINVADSRVEDAAVSFLAEGKERFDPVARKKALEAYMRLWAGVHYGHSAKETQLPFALFGFNRTALINLPGEIFSAASLELRKRFKNINIITGELADTDSPGYVPVRSAFNDGGYEVTSAVLEKGAAERITGIASDMLEIFISQFP